MSVASVLERLRDHEEDGAVEERPEGCFTTTEYMKDRNVGHETARRRINKFIEEGVLKRVQFREGKLRRLTGYVFNDDAR